MVSRARVRAITLPCYANAGTTLESALDMEEPFETKTLAAGETLLLHDKLAEVVEGNLVDGEGFVFHADELIGVEAVLGGSHLFRAAGPAVVRIYPWEPSSGMIERLAREVLRLRREREQIRLAAVDESLMAGLRERGRVANTQALIKDALLQGQSFKRLRKGLSRLFGRKNQ